MPVRMGPGIQKEPVSDSFRGGGGPMRGPQMMGMNNI